MKMFRQAGLSLFNHSLSGYHGVCSYRSSWYSAIYLLSSWYPNMRGYFSQKAMFELGQLTYNNSVIAPATVVISYSLSHCMGYRYSGCLSLIRFIMAILYFHLYILDLDTLIFDFPSQNCLSAAKLFTVLHSPWQGIIEEGSFLSHNVTTRLLIVTSITLKMFRQAGLSLLIQAGKLGGEIATNHVLSLSRYEEIAEIGFGN